MPHPSPWRFSQLAGSLSHLSFRAGMGKSSALSAARLCFPGRDEVGSERLPLPSSVPWVSDSSEEDSERRALGTVFTGDTQKGTIKTYSCLGSSRHTWLGKHFSDASECGQKSRGSASLPELCPRLTNKEALFEWVEGVHFCVLRKVQPCEVGMRIQAERQPGLRI